ncbi:pyridoxamine 5'-phosphate oxidase family protein [Christensenellaceae bacterium OttesenSCG-928-L17]|nr:pyridoxamine 5'-phosphate oxidase family protein [Christensenellaceae bacterium OttesenSCG-928-L17]
MEEVFSFLKKLKVNFLATIEPEENKPNLRPFGDPVLFDGKIYCLTLKDKNVYREIAANNNVCIVAIDDKDRWIRIKAKLVDDSENTEAKKAIIAEFDWAEEAGYTLNNPNFACLYLAEAIATISDIDDKILSKHEF